MTRHKPQPHLDEHEPAPDRWGEVFGDDVVAAAMIDRLKDRDLGRTPAATND